ncbi:MAG: hypothetical protein KIT11_00685 [Fimbriimonadaceae bacterium]|nr:hypothetical protein [Fimbriimonadaceae bacterium]QYK55111.1 MAG: hypothetical protein KF733_08850 [Fimbriimonadaceae bacterium]
MTSEKREAYDRLRRDPASIFKTGRPDEVFGQTDVLGCTDSRVPIGLCCAGSMLLLSPEERTSFLERSGAKGITSHSECGAGGIAFERKRGRPAADAAELDAWVREQTEEIADDVGCVYAGHIGPDQFVTRQHEARVTYVVAAPMCFNPSKDPYLANGFIVSHFAHRRSASAVEETAVTLALSFQFHAGGEAFFTGEEPFLLVGIGDPDDPTESGIALRLNLERALDLAVINGPLSVADRGRVQILTVDAPREIIAKYRA